MFSPSSPAATTGPFRSAPAAEAATAIGAGPAPAGDDEPSFGDALSAAVDHTGAQGESPNAIADSATAASATLSTHGAAAMADGPARGQKNRASRSIDARETDPDTNTKEDQASVTVLDATVTLSPSLIPVLRRLFAAEPACAARPEPDAKGPAESLAAVAVRLARGTPDAAQAAEASAIGSDAAATAPVAGGERTAAESGLGDTTPAGQTKSRAAATLRELSAAFSGSVRNWKDAQQASASTSATRAQDSSLIPGETAPNASAATTARESTTAMLVQQSLAARIVTAGVLGHSTSLTEAAGPAAETPVLPQSVTDQMIEAIRLQWTAGGGVARIQLEPVHFGELTVSVRVEQGQVTARLEAANPAVREWLQTNHALLRGGLAAHNLTLDRFDVGEPPETRDADRRRQQQSAPREERRPRRSPRPDTGELFEVVA